MKKLFYVLSVFLLFSLPNGAASAQALNAADLHFSSTVVDGHNDTMMKVVDPNTWLPVTNIRSGTDFQVDIPKIQAGGLDVPFFAAYTSGYYGNTPRSLSRTLALINALYWTQKQNSDVLHITSSFKDIQTAVKGGKIAAFPTIEGAYSLEKKNAIELLHQYYDLGIRAVGFTWNYSNALGEGANKVYGDPARTPSSGGLTELGEEVAREMNKLGMIIDASHMSENTFWDVIKVSQSPIIASHSSAYSLRNHQRNLTDDQLKALAENGGVVGVVLYPEFLTDRYPNESASIKDYVDHIDHVVKVAGIDHVALGSDFDGGPLPADLKDSSELPKITEELVSRGYSKQDLQKLLGENMLRVLREVEKAAEYNPADDSKNLKLVPSLQMGETITSNTPLLTAKVEGKQLAQMKEESLRIVVDGIPYTPHFDPETSNVSVQLQEPLKEKFHVVTFEAKTSTGKAAKETRVFYINQ